MFEICNKCSKYISTHTNWPSVKFNFPLHYNKSVQHTHKTLVFKHQTRAMQGVTDTSERKHCLPATQVTTKWVLETMLAHVIEQSIKGRRQRQQVLPRSEGRLLLMLAKYKWASEVRRWAKSIHQATQTGLENSNILTNRVGKSKTPLAHQTTCSFPRRQPHWETQASPLTNFNMDLETTLQSTNNLTVHSNYSQLSGKAHMEEAIRKKLNDRQTICEWGNLTLIPQREEKGNNCTLRSETLEKRRDEDGAQRDHEINVTALDGSPWFIWKSMKAQVADTPTKNFLV